MKRTGRILIVDDESMNVDILHRLLCTKYELETADTGNACLVQLMTFRPHLVLLDIMMPGISGHETCRRIKLSPLSDFVRIILVSAQQTIVDVARGSDVLADDYLIKPFDHGEILSKVRAQFDAMATGTGSESISDAELLASANQMSEPQRGRLAAALRRLPDDTHSCEW